MLTSDLLRYRLEGSRVIPDRLSASALPLARSVIAAHRDCRGLRRARLEKALRELERSAGDGFLVKCFAKLLESRTAFLIPSLLDPEGIRKEVFLRAHRDPEIARGEEVFREVARRKSVTAREVERSLFADLPQERVLIEIRLPSPQWLLDRYNMAQAQGLLYGALRLRCRFSGALKKIFTHVRMLRLMYRLEASGEGEYRLVLDGPLSVLRHTRRYGIRLSRVLPAICLAERFDLEADVCLRGETYRLRLDSASGLVTHYKPDPLYDSEVERSFAGQFAALASPWKLERETGVVDLGGAVFIPDFTFRHPSGRSVHLEIVGFWTPEYLRNKLAKLSEAAGRGAVLVAVSRRLGCSGKEFPAPCVWYGGRLDAEAVLERLNGFL